MVDTSLFPDMAAMVSYGAARHVKMGFYGNNCRCNGGQTAADKWQKLPADVEHYAQDAQYTLDAGFAGTKIDSCGDQRDMDQYASRFAAAGKELLVESCGNGPKGTNPKKDSPPMQAFLDQLRDTCPFSLFRVSVDVAPQFFSTVYNANRAVPYLDHAEPLSRPGCW